MRINSTADCCFIFLLTKRKVTIKCFGRLGNTLPCLERWIIFLSEVKLQLHWWEKIALWSSNKEYKIWYSWWPHVLLNFVGISLKESWWNKTSAWSTSSSSTVGYCWSRKVIISCHCPQNLRGLLPFTLLWDFWEPNYILWNVNNIKLLSRFQKHVRFIVKLKVNNKYVLFLEVSTARE